MGDEFVPLFATDNNIKPLHRAFNASDTRTYEKINQQLMLFVFKRKNLIYDKTILNAPESHASESSTS